MAYQITILGPWILAMRKIDKINYWVTSSENDWVVAGHLLEKGDYPYSLFFGHLALEKMLKAFFVSAKDDIPPLNHRLVYLAEKAGLDLTDVQIELLEIVTDFNLEARYPDEKFSFQKSAPGNLRKLISKRSRS